jgi:hypothetical protein
MVAAIAMAMAMSKVMMTMIARKTSVVMATVVVVAFLPMEAMVMLVAVLGCLLFGAYIP